MPNKIEYDGLSWNSVKELKAYVKFNASLSGNAVSDEDVVLMVESIIESQCDDGLLEDQFEMVSLEDAELEENFDFETEMDMYLDHEQELNFE